MLQLTNNDEIISAISMQKVDGHWKQKPKPQKLAMFTWQTLSKCPSYLVTLQSKYGELNIFFLDMWQIWGIFFHKIFCNGYRPLLFFFLVTKWQNFTPKIVNCVEKNVLPNRSLDMLLIFLEYFFNFEIFFHVILLKFM